MANIVLQPCADTASKRNYVRTIETPVPLASVEHLFGLEGPALRTAHPEGTAPMWGTTPHRDALKDHAATRIGDLVLFGSQGSYFLSGRIAATWRNPALARHLWGAKSTGETWELMYSLTDLTPMDEPYRPLNEIWGYEPTASPRRYRLLDPRRSALGLDHLHQLTAPPAVDLDAYARALDAADGELERQATTNQRVEQQYLRRALFGRGLAAECDLCGLTLPVDLLVAAHIKKRADCSRQEKLDVGNIVMAACRLGCDELYERGYLGVSARGIVIATSQGVPEALASILSDKEGRTCSAFRPATEAYFAHHRGSVFQR